MALSNQDIMRLRVLCADDPTWPIARVLDDLDVEENNGGVYSTSIGIPKLIQWLHAVQEMPRLLDEIEQHKKGERV